ncbi:MAG: hypothetical protein M3Y56_06400 [Armatimonadota bacterium]|nr:hypothetical protein [Armatimonadota bacterium]
MPRDLYDKGYRVARALAAVAIDLGLSISLIDTDGHVDVTAARDHAIDFAEASTVLNEEETFPSPR